MKKPYGHKNHGHSGTETQRHIEQAKYHHQDMQNDGGDYYYRSNKPLIIGGVIGVILILGFIFYGIFIA